MTAYPFSSLPQNRDCFGEAGVSVEPCPEYPCIHTPCHDPDYLADNEDNLRDPEYHRRLWWEYDEANRPRWPLPIFQKDEETERREAERWEELYKLFMQSEELKPIVLELHPNGFPHYNVDDIVIPPLSEEQRRDFASKFERCRRLQAKDRDIKRDMRRFSIKRKIEEFKSLDNCPNKDTQAYKEIAEYRDQILNSVAETGDYLFGWDFIENICDQLDAGTSSPVSPGLACES